MLTIKITNEIALFAQPALIYQALHIPELVELLSFIILSLDPITLIYII